MSTPEHRNIFGRIAIQRVYSFFGMCQKCHTKRRVNRAQVCWQCERPNIVAQANHAEFYKEGGRDNDGRIGGPSDD